MSDTETTNDGAQGSAVLPAELDGLTDEELRELAGDFNVDLGEDPLDRPIAEEKLREAASAAATQEPPEDDEQTAQQPPPAEDRLSENTKLDGAGRVVASEATGKTATVTYLGRPETIPKDEAGDPIDEDVYGGVDPWNDGQPVNLAVGESTQVSVEKATQLEQDFPGAFEIST